jgi:hypothetical protein
MFRRLMGLYVKIFFKFVYLSFVERNASTVIYVLNIFIKFKVFTRNYWVFGLCPSTGILKN